VNSINYLGLDVHKKTISYCLRQADGTILREGTIEATREALAGLQAKVPQPWIAGLEATMFSAWIRDHIRAQGGKVKVAHSMMLRAIAAGKRKNDRIDARKIADLLRCPGCAFVWLAPLLLLVSTPAAAIDPHQSTAQMYHSAWTAKEGVIGIVFTMAQTSDGFLWLGTSNGLLRFGGVSFERYKPEAGTLPEGSITSLLATPDGGLWIGYRYGGASFLKRGQVAAYDEREGLRTGGVRSLVQDLDGITRAAVVGGLARFDGQR